MKSVPYLTAEQAQARGPRDVPWELWDGVLVVSEPAGGSSGPVAVRISARLLAAAAGGDLGWVGDAETGYVVQRSPDRVLSPDVSFVSRERLPAWPVRGFPECAPDLAVEVRSPRDTWSRVLQRGGVWIAHGVRVVWVVDPLRRRAAVLRPTCDAEEIGIGGTLSGAPVLPDLAIPLREVLAGLD